MGYRRTVQGERGRVTELYAAEQLHLDDGYDHLGDDVSAAQRSLAPRLVSRRLIKRRPPSRSRLPGEVREVQTSPPARKLVVPGPATGWKDRVATGVPLVENIEEPELDESQLPAPKMPGAPARGHDLPVLPSDEMYPGTMVAPAPPTPDGASGLSPLAIGAIAVAGAAAIWWFTRKGGR